MIGIVTGLRAEARLLAGLGHPVSFAGNDPAGAARKLAEKGLSGLVSFGMAGGLCPHIRPGTLVLASEIVTRDARLPTSAPWRNRVSRALPQAVQAALAGVDQPPVTRRLKADLLAATGARAVDMESHAVARVAAEFRLPLLVLRAIADPAERDVPRAALAGLDMQGILRPGRVAAGLLHSPSQTVTLLRLAVDFRHALASLRRSAALIAG